MCRVYYTTTTCPLCRCVKMFNSYDDAIQWVETMVNLADYFIE